RLHRSPRSTLFPYTTLFRSLLCLYAAVAKKQGADLRKLSGTVQNDILKEYIARGTYIYPLRPPMRIVTDIFAWCHSELPKWNTRSEEHTSELQSRFDLVCRL